MKHLKIFEGYMDRFYYENPDVSTLSEFVDLSIDNCDKIEKIVGKSINYVELIDVANEDELEDHIGQGIMASLIEFSGTDRNFERVTVYELEDEWFYVEVDSYENGNNGPRFTGNHRTYNCDGFDGLKKLFEDMGFTKINESRSTMYYMIISDSESNDLFYRRDSISITEREYGILKKIVRKKKGDLKYEVIYEESYIGGTVGEEKDPEYSIEIQGRPDYYTRDKIFKNYHINKYDDDWFHVSVHEKKGKKSVLIVTEYKCDQFDGVVKLLSDLDMIYQKYKK